MRRVLRTLGRISDAKGSLAAKAGTSSAHFTPPKLIRFGETRLPVFGRALGVAMALAAAASAGPVRAAEQPEAVRNIVLVHGAFSDGSSWKDIIPLLQSRGYNVTAVQNPLTSLADDVAVTRR